MENYIIEGRSMIIIDGDKLREIVYATGKTGADISRDFGQGSGSLTQACSRGRISRAFAKFLEKEYDIPIEAYAKMKEEPQEEKTTETEGADFSEILNKVEEVHTELHEVKTKLEKIPDIRIGNGQDSALTISKQELANVIYRAVYSAVKHAWEEPEEK